MANYMADVARLLGVEMNKDFECEESNCTYRITEHGLTCNGCYGADSLMMLLSGERIIKQGPWRPKYGEDYYCIGEYGQVIKNRCENCWMDTMYYKVGNCYKTEDQARFNTHKWVSFYASDEVLEV